MKKAEAEPAIRSLAREWAREVYGELPLPPDVHPVFSRFQSWLEAKGYGRYLDFRSTIGPPDVAEIWFDDELGQSWRN